MQIGVREKAYGPPFLMLGLDVGNIDASNFAVNMLGRVLQYGWVGVGSETRLDFALGTNQRVGGELVKPLGDNPVFLAGRVYFDRRGRNLYSDDVFVAEYRITRLGLGADIGTDIGRDAEIRLGYDITDFAGRRRIGAPYLPEVDGTEEFLHLNVFVDTQTSPLVPTRGFRLRSALRQFFSAPTASAPVDGVIPPSPQSFTSGEVRTSWFTRVRNRDDRLFLIGEGGTSFGAHPLVDDFALGGPLRVGWLTPTSCAATTTSSEWRGTFAPSGGCHARRHRFSWVVGRGGVGFQRLGQLDWKSDATGGLILETLLGPVFLGGSVGFDGGGRFYVSLGPLFK